MSVDFGNQNVVIVGRCWFDVWLDASHQPAVCASDGDSKMLALFLCSHSRNLSMHAMSDSGSAMGGPKAGEVVTAAEAAAGVMTPLRPLRTAMSSLSAGEPLGEGLSDVMTDSGRPDLDSGAGGAEECCCWNSMEGSAEVAVWVSLGTESDLGAGPPTPAHPTHQASSQLEGQPPVLHSTLLQLPCHAMRVPFDSVPLTDLLG